MTGRSLPHAMMMMIPEPWQNHETMDPTTEAFYEYHSCLMEPWDGPASIAFTDGTMIGAVLDRNGLRPSRYYVTKDDLVIMASEVGVLDIPAENIVLQGAAAPGQACSWSTPRRAGSSTTTRSSARSPRRSPTAQWLDEHLIDARAICRTRRSCPQPDHTTRAAPAAGLRLHAAKTCSILMAPMAADGEEPIGSMGTDTPLAVLSRPAAAALQLLQAAVRAGDQPAARRDPRGADHVDGIDRSARKATCSTRRRSVPPDQAQVPDPQQRGAGQAARSSTQASPSFDAADRRLPMLLLRPTQDGPAWSGRSTSCAAGASAADQGRRQHPDPVRPRHRRDARCRSRACWRSPACTIT